MFPRPAYVQSCPKASNRADSPPDGGRSSSALSSINMALLTEGFPSLRLGVQAFGSGRTFGTTSHVVNTQVCLVDRPYTFVSVSFFAESWSSGARQSSSRRD
jgi:hypothetical protein